MPSKSSMDYLQRKRIFDPKRERPRFAGDSLSSHFRNVVFLPVLLGPDTPDNRVLTQEEKDRVPYAPVPPPFEGSA